MGSCGKDEHRENTGVWNRCFGFRREGVPYKSYFAEPGTGTIYLLPLDACSLNVSLVCHMRQANKGQSLYLCIRIGPAVSMAHYLPDSPLFRTRRGRERAGSIQTSAYIHASTHHAESRTGNFFGWFMKRPKHDNNIFQAARSYPNSEQKSTHE